MNIYEYAKRLIDLGILKIEKNGRISRKYKFNRYNLIGLSS